MQGIYLFLAGMALIAASAFDIKTREVPDWLNYGLIISGIWLHVLETILFQSYLPVLDSLLGAGIMFLLALLMFYGGQWGGGDSKLLIGLGATLGFNIAVFTKPFNLADMPLLFNFLLNLIFIGVFYGVFWSSYLAIKKREKFVPEFRKNLTIYRHYRIALLIAVALFFILSFFIENFLFKLLLFIIIVLLVFGFYIWLFAKSVERSCLLKYVEPKQLTEGDWIAKDVYVNKKYITGPKDLGIEKSKIQLLIKLKSQGKIRKILIKEGIPFVPSFLIAYIFTIWTGNFIIIAQNLII